MPEPTEHHNWYALHTRSNFEKRVATELSSKGFENYCPAFRETHRWADRDKEIERPVFPGYVFVRFTPSLASRLRVVETQGAVRILGVNGIPEAIPNTEIDSLRRVLESGVVCAGFPYPKAGDCIRVRRGALKDVEGILVRVKNRTRLVLSIHLLSQSVATEVDAQDVEVIRGRLPRPESLAQRPPMYPNLKLQLWKAGIRQNRLAKTLKMDEAMLSKIVNGFREPSEQLRREIAALLECEADWLFQCQQEPITLTKSAGQAIS